MPVSPRIPLFAATLTAALALSVLPGTAPATAAPLLSTGAISASAATTTTAAKPAAWTKVAVPNSSFRQGTRQWRAHGKRARLVTERQGHGDKRAAALRTTKRSTATVGPRKPILKRSIAGASYQASAWVRSDSVGTSVRLRLGGNASAGSVTQRTVTAKSRGWRKLVVRWVAPKSAPAVDLRVIATGVSPGRRVVVDDLELRVRKPQGSTGHPGQGHGGSGGGSGPAPTWKSGASGDGVATGAFGKWRGAPATIAGTWNDNMEAQINQWTLMPGFEYGSWQGDLDVAVGGIFKDQGETWAKAAAGAYDARWRTTLTNLATYWADKPGTLYIRFAHEFNGDWYPWSVNKGEVADFKATWARFRALQLELDPAAKLVFCPNADTSVKNDIDWRTAFPGEDQVDVLSVDSYNQWPYSDTDREFKQAMKATDQWGAPHGIERHRQFAAAQGLPFAISEWASNGDMGDSPVFMARLHEWLQKYAGTGPGQVLYEIQFNVGSYGGGNFQVFPKTQQPKAASMYRKLW